jgi:2,5-diketo-D-gluconate reductase A
MTTCSSRAVIGDIAEAHSKTPAQVMLRWHLQQGRSVIPKSTNPQRIAENIDVFDFQLSTEELAASTPLTPASGVAPSPSRSRWRTSGARSRRTS